MNPDQSPLVAHLDALIADLEERLRQEFPTWQIQREDSGTWTALCADLPIIVAASAAELREHLRGLGHAKATPE